MILIISGLPINFTYHDAKALIKQEARISNFILDHLGVDNNGKKKVTVGLVDVAEAPILVNRLNGFIVLDHRLTVAPLGGGGGGQPRPVGRNEPQFRQRGPEPQRLPPGQGYGYEPPRGAPAHRTFDVKGPSDAPRTFGQRPEPTQRPASVFGGAPAAQYGGQSRPMSTAPSSAPYQGQKPPSQGYGYTDEKYQPLSARSGPGALLKSPTGRSLDRGGRFSPPRQSPPRSYSPRHSPPRHTPMDPKAGKFVDPNFGPNRGRPAFSGPQAPTSGNFPGASYVGGEDRYRTPSQVSGTSDMDWKRPIPEPYNPLAPSMGRPSVPFAPRNQAPLDRPAQDAYRFEPDRAREDHLTRGRSPVRRHSRSPPRRSPEWSRPGRSPPRHRDRSPLRRSPPRDRRPAGAPWEGGRQRSPSPKLSRSRWDPSGMQEPLVGQPKVAMSVGISSRPDVPPLMRDKPSSFVTPAQSNTWADNLPPRDHISSRFAARSPLRDVGLPPIEGSGPYGQVQNSAPRRLDSDPYFDSQNSNFQGVRSHFGEPHESVARNDALGFGPQGAPRFGPRDGQQKFGPSDGVQDFDFVPRGGPRDGPRDLEPSGGLRDFGSRDGPRDGPRDFGPRDGSRNSPRDFGPRDRPRDGPRDFGLRDGPHELGPSDVPRDFVSRELGPRDGPPIFEPRGFGHRDEGPRDILGPRGDFGPPDDFRSRNGKPRDLPHSVEQDLGRREGPVFEPRLGRDYRDEEPREIFSSRERPAPFDRPGRPPFREEFRDARGDRPPSRHRSEGRNSNGSHSKRSASIPEKEMETRNAVINKITQQMIQNHKPRLHSTDSTLHDNVEHELRKVILQRIDSIFGLEFGHDFGSIARGYRQHHKTTGDSTLVEKIFAKCMASGYVRKRSPEDIVGPSAKKPRDVAPRVPQSAPRASASGGDGGAGTIPKYPQGGGDDRGRFKSPFIASFNPIQPMMDKVTVPQQIPNKNLYKLYIIKDDLADISVDEAMQIKTFFIDEIVKSATKSDFTPSFLLNGVQNLISFEVIAENEKSKDWLQNNNLNGFKPFSVLVYTTEELNYERASIFLPGFVDIPLKPMERLRLQNAHLKDLDIDKWKFVKSIVTIRGTRVFVDMSKSAAEALTKRDMMLNYQLEKVFVFLKSMSTDRCEFDKAFREESIILDKVQGLNFVPIHNLQSMKSLMKLNKDTVRISVDGMKIEVTLATKLMHLILVKMYEYLESKEGDSNETDFNKYICTNLFLAIYPTNHQSCNWLLSLDLGEIKGKKVLIETGQYFPKYLRVGIVVPGEIGEYGPSILQNINTYNKIEGVDFTKWKMFAQLTCKDESGSKVILDVDMQSLIALKAVENKLKYGDHDLIIPNSNTYLISQYEKTMTEMKDQYEVADMDIDGEENEDQIANNDDINIVDFDAQGFFREEDSNENPGEALVWLHTSQTRGARKNKKKTQKGQRNASQTPIKKPTSNDDKMKTIDKIAKHDNKKTKTVQQDTSKQVHKQNSNESKDKAKATSKNEVTVIDDDLMVYEGSVNNVIITIDSDDDDDEVARKKELESIFKCLNREIERRQTKDPLGRDLSLRVLYDSNENDMYQEKYEGKFTKMTISDLDYFHDQLIKMKPSKDKRRTAEDLESFLVKIRAKIENMSKS